MIWPFKRKHRVAHPEPHPLLSSTDPEVHLPSEDFWLRKGAEMEGQQEADDYENSLREQAEQRATQLRQFVEGRKARQAMAHLAAHHPEILAEIERLHAVRHALRGKR